MTSSAKDLIRTYFLSINTNFIKERTLSILKKKTTLTSANDVKASLVAQWQRICLAGEAGSIPGSGGSHVRGHSNPL